MNIVADHALKLRFVAIRDKIFAAHRVTNHSLFI